MDLQSTTYARKWYTLHETSEELHTKKKIYVRFQVLTAASMKFRIVSSLMVEAARTSETSVDNYFTRQYIPEDNYEEDLNEMLQKAA
jgi:23S rRNA C2498 (ribose-2'-O)-methylase RlmM